MTDIAELRALARSVEGSRLEFKRTTNELKGALETVCGFLNENGGNVIIGARNDGTILGQDVSENTHDNVAAELIKLEPVASVRCETIDIPKTNKRVLLLSANPLAELQPYTYDGRAFERIENTTRVMPQGKYQDLLLRRVQSLSRWETGISSGIRLSDLDLDIIRRNTFRAIEVGRIPDSGFRNIGDAINRLGLRVNGKLTNAAFALFGSQMLPHFPQCLIKMGRFRGTDKSEFIDNRQEYGNIFRILDEGLLFLRRHLPVSARVQPRLFERDEQLLFPLQALREGMVNAVCHRDYSLTGGAISLAIYDDRLEIWSDGSLPFGITIDALKQEHQSRPRNPLIASVLFKMGLVESWGRGTQKIVELCVGAGHPEPEFLEQGGAVGVPIYPARIHRSVQGCFQLD